MSIRSICNPWKFLLSILIVSSLSSCKEEITDIGTTFLRDTVFTGSQTIADLFSASAQTKQTINAQSVRYNLTYGSPYLFCGSVPDESLEAWPVLKVPFIDSHADTIKITSVELVLSMRSPFLYGANVENLDFSVYMETKKVITEATTSLSLSDLDPVPVGSFQSTIGSDSIAAIRITLDSGRITPLMHTTGLALVLVPNASMKNIRAFASNEFGNVLEAPYFSVRFSRSNPDTTYTEAIYPSYDYSVIFDRASAQTGQFSVRGAFARRERFTLNIKAIKSRLTLDPYSTINNALLQLSLVSTATSLIPVDTLKPVVVEITSPSIEDTAEYLVAFGTRDNASSDLYNFQLREIIEQAIRRNQDSLVVELRTGFAVRAINDENIGVEDYHLNRWTFYDFQAADSTKRPRVAITYSYLR